MERPTLLKDIPKMLGGVGMLSFGLIALVALLYLFGNFGWAFAVLVLAIINGWLAVVRSIISPNWYISQRIHAGLNFDYDLRGLVRTKIIVTALLSALAWHVGVRAGFF